jgi:hypothetical protein
MCWLDDNMSLQVTGRVVATVKCQFPRKPSNGDGIQLITEIK